MISVNGKILVSVDLKQKNSIKIGEAIFQTANAYQTNYRERSPVICKVVEGNDFVKENDILITHHNNFYLPSPYHVYDDLFSIPFGKTIFCKLKEDSSLEPICGNILCDRVSIETVLPIPIEQQKKYLDRIIVIDGGWTKYKPSQLLFTRPYSFYEIVYMVNGEEKRVHKISEDMVCGILR